MLGFLGIFRIRHFGGLTRSGKRGRFREIRLKIHFIIIGVGLEGYS